MLQEYRQALADLLKVDVSNVEEPTTESSRMLSCNGGVYLILDENEATVYMQNVLTNSLFRQKTAFLKKYMKEVPVGILIDIQSFGFEANTTLKRLLGEKFDDYCMDIITHFGGSRGTLLSKYDGLENRSGQFFIYRIQ